MKVGYIFVRKGKDSCVVANIYNEKYFYIFYSVNSNLKVQRVG